MTWAEDSGDELEEVTLLGRLCTSPTSSAVHVRDAGDRRVSFPRHQCLRKVLYTSGTGAGT